MIPKFNKQTGRWGVWISGEPVSAWVSNTSTDDIPGKPLRFQSKQEAAAHIRELQA